MTQVQSTQAPGAVVMIRPQGFTPNPQTAADNGFQHAGAADAAQAMARAAYDEVTAAAATLEAQGVTVHLFEDRGEQETPDSVFPNNWFSTHAGGHVALYPMYAPNRRRERRQDVIEMLKAQYRVQDVIDYSGLAPDGLFLEGTGAMVLDHIARVACTARFNRANGVALERFATHFNFEPMMFDAVDDAGQPIYHTNVLMCVATEFAMVGFDAIQDATRRAEIHARLASLLPAQKELIERSARIVPLSVPTIEMAGGSVRCMLAGIHLAKR
ncbi:MAG: arginine deiminase-related protein [Rhodoferax sp.]